MILATTGSIGLSSKPSTRRGRNSAPFLDGERRCPPEDCGGPPGYFEFMEGIASKRGKKAKEALEWYGGPYDPDDIDEQQINITLGRIANSHRTGRSKAVKK